MQSSNQRRKTSTRGKQPCSLGCSLGLTEEDIERIHAAYLSLVDVNEGEQSGVVNAKKLKQAVMFLNQDEIDAIVSG